ncbi:MAG: hypothetical protein ABEJ57_04055 [Halobacteriaceae archaeon]
MAETADAAGLTGHARSIAVTATATLMGVVGGVVSAEVAASATDRISLGVFLGAVLVAYVVMRVVGVDITEFSMKDNAYVTFMTFALWFITFSILLTGL